VFCDSDEPKGTLVNTTIARFVVSSHLSRLFPSIQSVHSRWCHYWILACLKHTHQKRFIGRVRFVGSIGLSFQMRCHPDDCVFKLIQVQISTPGINNFPVRPGYLVLPWNALGTIVDHPRWLNVRTITDTTEAWVPRRGKYAAFNAIYGFVLWETPGFL